MSTRELHFDKTIDNWDEALPLGNGDLGCLIWNSSKNLRFSIDKGGIWDCSNSPENQKDFTYSNLKELIKSKNQKAIVEKYDDCYNNVTPTKLPTGKIIIDLGVDENVVSHLDFTTAEAKLTIGNIKVRSFIHSTESYGLIEINGPCTYTVESPVYGTPKDEKTDSKGITQSLKNLIYPPKKVVEESEDNIYYQYFIQPTNDCFYGIISAKTQLNSKTLIAYTVAISEKDDFVAPSKAIVKNALLKGYESALADHKKWWADFWGKSSVSLPNKELEKQWFLNTYLLGSGSRKGCFPMPLQGVWTADNGSLPPWKGDYHHDLNTQMTYTSYLKSNHLSQGECFIDYLLDLAPRGEAFAKSFYGVKGLCMPSVMDIKGYALGGWSQYALAPTNQLWLCQIMTRYYFFTKNQNYLKKIYEYNCKVGEFLINLLTEKDGFYKLPLSTSPEINDNSLDAWLTPNTNYDLALMQCFMEDMVSLSEEIGNRENADIWRSRRKKLEDLKVNDKNILMLSPDKSLEESHRHHAHCMAIYPLRTLEYDTEKNKKIIDATVKNLEELGISEWTGYSVGWLAELYISQGNGNKAEKELMSFFKYNCTKNGFHINGDYLKKTDFNLKYRLFTLEGNFLAADAIQDMLLYSEKGKIKLFPAIPKEWENASFKGFRGFSGIIVSCKMEKGKIKELKITAENNCNVEILNDLSYLTPNISLKDHNILNLKAGEEIIFS